MDSGDAVGLGVVFGIVVFLLTIFALAYSDGLDKREKTLECHKVNQHRPAVDTKLLCNPV